MNKTAVFPFNSVLYTRDQRMYEWKVILLFIYSLVLNSNILLQFQESSGIIGALMMLMFPFVMLLSGLYFFDIILIKKRVNFFDVIILYLLVVPCFNSVALHYAFDIPIFKALFNSFGKAFIVSNCFMYFLVRTNKITLKQSFTAALMLCWFSFLLYMYLQLTKNPANFKDSDGLVGYNPSKGGYIFRFSSAYLVLGMVYYFVNFLLRDSISSLLLWLVLIAYQLFFDKGRAELISMLIPLVLFMFIRLKWHQIIKKLFQVMIVVGIMFLIAYWIDPGLLVFVNDMFIVFFKFFLGQDTGEASADSRWLQMAEVYSYYVKHPEIIFFGVGVPKEETMLIQVGNVNLNDIGIVGVLFSQGVIGTIYNLLIYLFPAYVFFKIKHYKNDLLFNVGILGCVVTFIQTMFSGGAVYGPFGIVYFLMFIEYYRVKEKLYWKNLALNQ